MAKWKVLRDNYGWKNGYWKEGDVHEFAEQEQPPKEHFVRVGREVPIPETPVKHEGQMAMSELATTPAQAPESAGKKSAGRSKQAT